MKHLLVITMIIVSATMLPVGQAHADKGGRMDTCSKAVFVPAYAPVNLTGNLGARSQVLVNTGFTLLPGLPVSISATGTAKTFPTAPALGPKGDGACNLYCLAPNLPAYALVAQVASSPIQLVGAGPTTISGAGPLYLAYNDRVYNDNSGGFEATITYQGKPGHGYGDKNLYHCGPPGQNG